MRGCGASPRAASSSPSAGGWIHLRWSYHLTAFVEHAVRQGAVDAALAELRKIPEIIEIHSTTGDADLLLRVVARDTTDLHRITNLMLETPGVLRTNTSIALLEVMPLRLTDLLRQTAEGK